MVLGVGFDRTTIECSETMAVLVFLILMWLLEEDKLRERDLRIILTEIDDDDP